jgi:hypothetical protein
MDDDYGDDFEEYKEEFEDEAPAPIVKAVAATPVVWSVPSATTVPVAVAPTQATRCEGRSYLCYVMMCIHALLMSWCVLSCRVRVANVPLTHWLSRHTTVDPQATASRIANSCNTWCVVCLTADNVDCVGLDLSRPVVLLLVFVISLFCRHGICFKSISLAPMFSLLSCACRCEAC